MSYNVADRVFAYVIIFCHWMFSNLLKYSRLLSFLLVYVHEWNHVCVCLFVCSKCVVVSG